MSSLAGGGRPGLLSSVAARSLSHHKTAVKEYHEGVVLNSCRCLWQRLLGSLLHKINFAMSAAYSL